MTLIIVINYLDCLHFKIHNASINIMYIISKSMPLSLVIFKFMPIHLYSLNRNVNLLDISGKQLS